MATGDEALRNMRSICLSLPDTTEGSHYGETAWYVKKKLFAACGDKNGACEVTFGLEPSRAAALVASDPRFRPYARDARGVVIDASQVKSWSEIEKLIVESYELRKPRRAKTTKKPVERRRRSR
jgi:predicted DNA-binding protein (MmcQ/YjbR family)